MASRRVWLDGKELLPGPSQKVWNHSPDGFNWGYGGSGPAQLALAVFLALTRDKSVAMVVYQGFKWDIIAKLPQADFDVTFEWDLTQRPPWGGVLPVVPSKDASRDPAIESKPVNPAALPRSDQSGRRCGPGCPNDCYECPV
jgi:hypothetical protein